VVGFVSCKPADALISMFIAEFVSYMHLRVITAVDLFFSCYTTFTTSILMAILGKPGLASSPLVFFCLWG